MNTIHVASCRPEVSPRTRRPRRWALHNVMLVDIDSAASATLAFFGSEEVRVSLVEAEIGLIFSGRAMVMQIPEASALGPFEIVGTGPPHIHPWGD